MSWFREVPVAILINVRILTTGYNNKTVDSLVMLSPSHVKTLCMQTYFRSSTIDPNNPSKVASVYDFGGSLKKHSPYFEDWLNTGKKSCMEEAKELTGEMAYFAILGCKAEPIVTICDGKPSSQYIDNPFYVNMVVTTPNIKPCMEVFSIHDMTYKTEEDPVNRGIIYKETTCKCGFSSRVVLKCMSVPSDLVMVYDDNPPKDTNKVLCIYSKTHKKVLLILDEPKLVSYKFRLASNSAEVFQICKQEFKDKPFTISSSIKLTNLPNVNINKSLSKLEPLVNWEDEDKNQSVMYKYAKLQVEELAHSFGYGKGYPFYFMKIVDNPLLEKNLKKLHKMLGTSPDQSKLHKFKTKYEKQLKESQ